MKQKKTKNLYVVEVEWFADDGGGGLEFDSVFTKSPEAVAAARSLLDSGKFRRVKVTCRKPNTVTKNLLLTLLNEYKEAGL